MSEQMVLMACVFLISVFWAIVIWHSSTEHLVASQKPMSTFGKKRPKPMPLPPHEKDDVQ